MVADLEEVEREEVQILGVDLQHGEECQVVGGRGEVDLRQVVDLLWEEAILEVGDRVEDLGGRSVEGHLEVDLPSLDLQVVDLSLELSWEDLRVLKVWDLRPDLPVVEVEFWTETRTDARPAWWRR